MRLAFFVVSHASAAMRSKAAALGVKSHERGPQPKSIRAPWRVLDRAHVPAQALQRVGVTAPLVGDPARDAVAIYRGIRAAGLRPTATPKRGLARKPSVLAVRIRDDMDHLCRGHGAVSAHCEAPADHDRRDFGCDDRNRRLRDGCKRRAGALHRISHSISARVWHARCNRSFCSVHCRAVGKVHAAACNTNCVIYTYVFTTLSLSAQILFALLLVLKILIKHWVGERISQVHMTDLKPQVVIFNAKIFHSLYMAIWMQNSTSKLPIALLTTVDFLQACVVLRRFKSRIKATSQLWTQSSSLVPIVRRPRRCEFPRYQPKPAIVLLDDNWSPLL